MVLDATNKRRHASQDATSKRRRASPDATSNSEHNRLNLQVGCWNMRTLVEAEGSIETSLTRPGSRRVTVDRKATLMVCELKKYRMNATGISETKWFGQNVYEIDGYTILDSGRPVPSDGEAAERNEGVGIVLDPAMTVAWKNDGGTWKPVSSRLISARVKLNRASGGRRPIPVYVTIISAYAPTHRSTQEKKDEFYAELQSTLDSIQKEDVVMLLGDFNARVGSGERVGNNPSWNGVRGCHGVGKMNENGEALMTFCALYELVIMNTTFEKKNIHKYTWQHPGSKQWHCIDYVIMRQAQRRLCYDVAVLRTAECWTDHKLLRAKVKLRAPAKVAGAKTRKRLAVSGLLDVNVKKEFNESVRKAVEEERRVEANGNQKWAAIKESMIKVASHTLGYEQRKQPDWFKENEPHLKKLIQKRNILFSKWLGSNQHSDKQRYVAQRRAVALEIRKAKNEWYQRKASEIEHGMTTGVVGRGVWQGLREIQRGRRGLQPVRPRMIWNKQGEPCSDTTQSLERWREHFEVVLNVTSAYSEVAIEAIHQHQIREDLAEPPTEDEIEEAIGCLRMHKAGGKSGILPELVKSSGPCISDNILDLFHTVWREGKVPSDWRDAMHNTRLYMLFVDLRKAYDSVPRETLWRVLTKYGIPPVLVNIMRE